MVQILDGQLMILGCVLLSGCRRQIVMVDMAGRIIYQQSFDAAQSTHEIDSERFDSGVYTLVVTSGENRHVQKLVIID